MRCDCTGRVWQLASVFARAVVFIWSNHQVILTMISVANVNRGVFVVVHAFVVVSTQVEG